MIQHVRGKPPVSFVDGVRLNVIGKLRRNNVGDVFSLVVRVYGQSIILGGKKVSRSKSTHDYLPLIMSDFKGNF